MIFGYQFPHCTFFVHSLCEVSRLVIQPRLKDLPPISDLTRQSLAWRRNIPHIDQDASGFVFVDVPKPAPKPEYEASTADGTHPVDPSLKTELYRNDDGLMIERVLKNGKIVSERLAHLTAVGV